MLTVGRLVKYSGYGNAAGLLARRGLLGGGQKRKAHRPAANVEAAASATPQSDSFSDDSETEEYASLKDQYALNRIWLSIFVLSSRVGQGRSRPGIACFFPLKSF